MNYKNLSLHELRVFVVICIVSLNITFTLKSQREIKKESIDPIKNLLPLLQPFIISQSVEKIVEFLKQFEPATSYIVAEHIIKEKESSLNKEDKEQLIIQLAHTFNKNTDMQKKFFDLLFVLYKTITPLQLVHIAQYGYAQLTPAFIAWTQERKAQHPELKDIALQSLFSAVDTNAVDALKMLLGNDVAINKKQASQLLWHAVSLNKNPKFIQVLADHHADLWSTSKGHTLVTKAVELNNKDMIQALIGSLKKQGVSQKKIAAYLNRFVDNTIGSPLQIALAKKFTDLEIYLREQGAGE